MLSKTNRLTTELNAKDNASAKIRAVGQSFDSLGNSAQTLQTKLSSIGTTFSKMGALASVASVALGRFMYGTIQKASSLNEALSRTEVVFGNSAKAIVKWSETMDVRFGQSQVKALETATHFTRMLKSAGFDKQLAEAMGITMTELASDIASFEDIPISEAVTAITGVVTGETESIKRRGVMIHEYALAEQIMRESINKSIRDMNQKEKTTLRYNQTLRQTVDMHGDFDRTSMFVANQQRILSAEFENMQVKLGEGLLPVWLKLIDFARDLIEKYEKLSPAVKELVSYILALSVGIGPVLVGLGVMFNVLSGMIGVVTFLLTPIGLLTAAIVGVGLAIAGWAIKDSLDKAEGDFGLFVLNLQGHFLTLMMGIESIGIEIQEEFAKLALFGAEMYATLQNIPGINNPIAKAASPVLMAISQVVDSSDEGKAKVAQDVNNLKQMVDGGIRDNYHKKWFEDEVVVGYAPGSFGVLKEPEPLTAKGIWGEHEYKIKERKRQMEIEQAESDQRARELEGNLGADYSLLDGEYDTSDESKTKTRTGTGSGSTGPLIIHSLLQTQIQAQMDNTEAVYSVRDAVLGKKQNLGEVTDAVAVAGNNL